MDWKSFVEGVFQNQIRGDWDITPIFQQPATMEAIEAVEEKVGVTFHDELRSLLLETDGIREWMKTDNWEGDIGYLVFSLDQIEDVNITLRTLEGYPDIYMPFENLLFVAPTGTGNYFGYSILNGEIRRKDIFVWNHDNDSRVHVAPSLKQFIEWWMLGKIRY
jgi:hypothetical protein